VTLLADGRPNHEPDEFPCALTGQPAFATAQPTAFRRDGVAKARLARAVTRPVGRELGSNPIVKDAAMSAVKAGTMREPHGPGPGIAAGRDNCRKTQAAPCTADETIWQKSSLSLANGDCVEVAALPDGLIGVRDSKDASGPVLRFTHGEWSAFLAGVRNGEFAP
jgi:uncharacterized protein DUF397